MRRLAWLPALLAALGLAPVAAGGSAHGQLLRVRANTNQSSNWFGYDLGSLERGNTLFDSISGDWTVPAAAPHAKGQAASSSDWIGIGGGCVDAACTVSDATLIQTGTEQDVDASGAATYSAWWETVPGPSLTIPMTIAPGDHMHASLTQVAAGTNLWQVLLRDVTRNEAFTQTIPYSSSFLTAEWVEEKPLLLGTSLGFAALPNLTSPVFTSATVNGAPAGLTPAEELELIDANGAVIGTPSAPNASHDGFAACAWATSCGLAAASPAAAPKTGSPAAAPRRKSRVASGCAGSSRARHHAAPAPRRSRRSCGRAARSRAAK